MVLLFLVLGIVLCCLTLMYSRWIEREIAKAIPSETVFFYKAGERNVIPLRPYEIKEYLESLTKTAFYTGPAFILSVFLFLLVILIPLYRRTNAALLEAFVKQQGAG